MQPAIRLFEASGWKLPFGMSSVATDTSDPAQQVYFGRIDAPGAAPRDRVQGDPTAGLAPGLRCGGTGGQDTISYALQPFGAAAGSR